MPEPPIEPARKAPPRRRGCLVWGCLVAAVPLVILAGAAAYVGYAVLRYTSPAPVPIEVHRPRPGEHEDLVDRLEALGEGAAPPRIELTAGDLNTLLVGGPEGERYAGKIHVRIEGDRVLADVSLPLSELQKLGLEALSRRYLNGTLELALRLDDQGRPVVAVQSATAAGRSIPEVYLSQLRDRNLLNALPADVRKELPETMTAFEVRGGRVVIQLPPAR